MEAGLQQVLGGLDSQEAQLLITSLNNTRETGSAGDAEGSEMAPAGSSGGSSSSSSTLDGLSNAKLRWLREQLKHVPQFDLQWLFSSAIQLSVFNVLLPPCMTDRVANWEAYIESHKETV
jgi:hypothetical protein